MMSLCLFSSQMVFNVYKAGNSIDFRMHFSSATHQYCSRLERQEVFPPKTTAGNKVGQLKRFNPLCFGVSQQFLPDASVGQNQSVGHPRY